MANIDPTLMQQVFYIPKRKRKPDIQNHRQANDLGRGLEIAKGVVISHPTTVAMSMSREKPFSSDNSNEHIQLSSICFSSLNR
jgi:hypothetical protein